MLAVRVNYCFSSSAISLSDVFFVSHVHHFSSLRSFPTGAFLGSINLPVTVPNAEFASMGDISRQ